MGHHFNKPNRNNILYEEKMISFIRRNRKKILLVLAGLFVIGSTVIVLIGVYVWKVLLANKDVIINPDTMTQAQTWAEKLWNVIIQLLNSDWIQNLMQLQSIFG